MLKKLFSVERTPTRRAFVFFFLAFLVVLLLTLATGLIWCQPTYSAVHQEVSPVGTWVSADAWERGGSHADTVVRFTDDGLVFISVNDYSALYRYTDDTLYLLELDGSSTDDFISDSEIPAGAESYRCVIAGDHMSFYGQIAGMMIYHGRTDLIRISPQTELSSEEIAELY